MIESLFSNPVLSNAIFSKLKKLAKENGIKFVTLQINEKGDIIPEIYKEEMRCITEQEFENLINNQK